MPPRLLNLPPLELFRGFVAVGRSLSVTAAARELAITISTGFAALWLLPRLGQLQATHPDVDLRVVASNRVLDLEREAIDLAVRYCTAENAPSGAVRLFGEELLPVSSAPVDLDDPVQLAKAVLLDYDDPAHPLLHWAHWLRASGAPRPKPGRVLRFTQYEQAIQSALAGHGVALGRLALVRPFLDSGQLLAATGRRPLSIGYGYWLVSRSRPLGRNAGRVREWILSRASERAQR